MLHGHLLTMYTFSCGCVLNVALFKSCLGLICTLYPTESILQIHLELIHLISHEHSSYLVITTSQVAITQCKCQIWWSIWQVSKLEQPKPHKILLYKLKEALIDDYNQRPYLLENKRLVIDGSSITLELWSVLIQHLANSHL